MNRINVRNTTVLFLLISLITASLWAASPVGWWKFDDNASSATALDNSGYGRNGTFYSGRGVLQNTSVSHSPDCPEGTGSFIFDGSDDFVEISGYNGILGGNSRTCTAWVKTTAGSTFDIITWGRWNVSVSPINGRLWVFRVNVDGTLAVGVWGGNIKTSTTVNDGNWHHVAAVLNNDGSPTLNEIKLFIDGVQQSTTASSTTVTINSSNNTTDGSGYVVIGANSDLGSLQGECFKGQIDDVRIYNTALSTAEIGAMITWPLSGTATTSENQNFTTESIPPEAASNPSPANEENYVSPYADLSWTAGSEATSHDVYFGTDLDLVTNSVPLVGDINGDADVNILDLEILCYQWLSDGSVSPSADIVVNGSVDLEDFAAAAATWGQTTAFKGNQTGTTYDPGILTENETYYWRIDEVNSNGTTTGTVYSFTTEARLTPEEFVIMPWDGPAGRDYTASICNTIRDCGFNLTGITFVDPYNSSPADLTNLDNAAAAGLKSLAYHYNTAPMTTAMANWSTSQINFYVSTMVSAVSDHPALFGYYLRDEPPSSDWPGLGNWVTSFKTYDPDKLVYMNLGWDYDFAGFVADTGQSDHLSYDMYGMRNDNAVDGYYFPCLENARSAADSTGLPFWNTVSSIRMHGSADLNGDGVLDDYPYWDVAAPTPENLRFQLYTSLAYGAQGISWFTYFDVISTPAAPIMWGTNGSKRIFWYYLQDVNMQLHRIGQTYVNMTWQNVFHHPNVPTGQPYVDYPSSGISSSNYVSTITGGDYVVGEFTGPSSTKYLMVVNKSLTNNAYINITFKTSTGTIKYVDPATGQLQNFTQGKTLLPGAGLLMKLN